MKVPKNLMAEILGTLERSSCKFWACRGPDVRPEFMITCIRCRTLRNLRRHMKREEQRENARAA